MKEILEFALGAVGLLIIIGVGLMLFCCFAMLALAAYKDCRNLWRSK